MITYIIVFSAYLFLTIYFVLRKPPTEINWLEGYRTFQSMKNINAWTYANKKFYKTFKFILPICILIMESIRILMKDFKMAITYSGIFFGICVLLFIIHVEIKLLSTSDKN